MTAISNSKSSAALEVDEPPFPSLADKPVPARPLHSLQIGIGWFPEHPGGLERFYFDLIHALPSHNVTCRGLVIGSDSVAATTNGRVCGFAPASATLLRRMKCARYAVQASMTADKFDLVVSHFSIFTLPVLRRIRRLPLVAHFHGPVAAEATMEGLGRLNALGKYHVERLVYSRATRLIVLSAAFREILVRDYAIAFDRICVIPGGIDAARFNVPETRRHAREKLGWPTDRPIVLCVRRLIRRMGIEDLIDAALKLRISCPEVLILVAGRGAQAESLQKRIDEAALGRTVRLIGFAPDVDLPLAYRAADLTIVPSKALEGFGLVAAESLAAGTPALVTPIGGLPAAVRGLSDQLVLDDSSALSLSTGIRRALRSEMKLPTADECRDYAKTNFDWSVIASKVRDVYQDAVGA